MQHMPNYHVEVHTKNNEVEHFVSLDCASGKEATDRIIEHYREKDIKIGLWEEVKDRPEINYYVFRVEELENKPVNFIAGEYRSSYPI